MGRTRVGAERTEGSWRGTMGQGRDRRNRKDRKNRKRERINKERNLKNRGGKERDKQHQRQEE